MHLKENVIFFNDLLAWIESNLTCKLTLDDVSKKAGYSKWYLQRAFRQYSGMGLGAYIRRRRLTLAAETLKTTSLSVKDIYILYNWNCHQTFTRDFKKYFGQSPIEWRNTRITDTSNMQPPFLDPSVRYSM